MVFDEGVEVYLMVGGRIAWVMMGWGGAWLFLGGGFW